MHLPADNIKIVNPTPVSAISASLMVLNASCKLFIAISNIISRTRQRKL